MSLPDTHAPAGRPKFGQLAIAGFILLMLFAGWYVMSQRQQVLRASPSGFDGLQTWLVSEKLSAQSFLGGWQVDPESIGVLIQPLYDTRPDKARRPVQTKEELLFQQDEFDQRMAPVLTKARRVPSLVILPKWRSGMRLTGIGHPILLNEDRRVEAILKDLTGLPGARIRYARTPFSSYDYTGSDGQKMSAQLYAAQLFAHPGCKPVIGSLYDMVLADCPLAGSRAGNRVLVLSDPDLLNNHGLRMGDNALIALDLLGSRAGNRNVMIDYSRDVWLTSKDKQVTRERTWADLKRFFGPPFLTLWLGAALTLGLFIWRAGLRYGPALSALIAQPGDRLPAVGARARLMRLTDQDGALIGEYARARLAATAAALFGPANARRYADQGAFLAYVTRSHPNQARTLEAVLNEIRTLPPRLPAAAAIRYVDELEALLEQITHDT